MSASGISTASKSVSARMGTASTPAKDVWRFPLALKGEMRTRRCVPGSVWRLGGMVGEH